MKTIAIDSNRDLLTDEYGNIATKEGNEQLAQDVATSIMVWKGELPMDIDRGIDYWNPETLGATLSQDMIRQANIINGVDEVRVELTEMDGRIVKPVIYVTNAYGETVEVQ